MLSIFKCTYKVGMLFATFSVAIVAYIVNETIVDEAKNRAAISRAFAYYENFTQVEHIKFLRKLEYKMKNVINTKSGSDKNKYIYTTIYGEEFVSRKMNKVREALVGAFQEVRLIHGCIESLLCDRDTIVRLTAVVLSDLFGMYKAILYCDYGFSTYFNDGKNYNDGKGSNFMVMWEDLVLWSLKNSSMDISRDNLRSVRNECDKYPYKQPN